jgi:membrane protein implicated in regulation of membrane protease activity
MSEWFDSLTTVQAVFLMFAGISTGLFMARVVMMFLGADHDGGDGHMDMDGGHGDLDLDHGGADLDGGDGDFDHGDGDVHAEHGYDSSDISFRLLSFQGLTAFFMMFGWVGLAMSKGSGFGNGISMIAGTGAGLVSVWIISRMFQGFSKLQSSGTMNLKNAIGGEGTVYLTVPKEGRGKVRVTVQGHLKVMEAVAEGGKELPTDTRIKVVDVVNGNVMVVKKL